MNYLDLQLMIIIFSFGGGLLYKCISHYTENVFKMVDIAKIQTSMAQILEADLGFPLEVELGGGAFMARSANQSQLEALSKAAGREVTIEPNQLNAFDKLLHELGAFQAMIFVGPTADCFLKGSNLQGQIADRSALFLSHIMQVKPSDVEFLYGGGFSFGRDLETETKFLRNLIRLADQMMLPCVFSFGEGITPELKAAMAVKLELASENDGYLFDLERPDHREFVNDHLGCNLPDIPPAGSRAKAGATINRRRQSQAHPRKDRG